MPSTEQTKRTVQVAICSRRYGSKSVVTVQTVDVPIVDGDIIRLDLTIDLRKTSSIEIVPVRRLMSDTAGVAEDAERLANS